MSDISSKKTGFGIGELGQVAESDWESEQEAERLQPTPRRDMVKCKCGHTVPRSQVMNANLGTSCPDCYDRMSE